MESRSISGPISRLYEDALAIKRWQLPYHLILRLETQDMFFSIFCIFCKIKKLKKIYENKRKHFFYGQERERHFIYLING